MPRLLVKFMQAAPGPADEVVLEAPTMPLALVVAEIGTTEGSTEIWDRTRRLARLRKRGPAGAPFWEVG